MKIVDARVVVSSPGRNYVTLVVEAEDGVIGLGDATLNGRELAVASTFGITSVHCSSAAMHAGSRTLAVPLPGRLLAARTSDDDRHCSG